MKKKFKFQMENGHLYEGDLEIAIKDGVAEIEETALLNPAVLHLIEAHGGQEIIEKPEPIPVKSKRKSKSEKQSDDSKEMSNILDKIGVAK